MKPATRDRAPRSRVDGQGGASYRHSRQRPVAGEHASRSRGNQRNPRRRSLTRRVLLSTVAVVLAAAAGFGVLLLATPGVGDAAARVAAHTGAGRLLTGPPPLRVQQALVATEDNRFYSHSGIDILGSMRATAGPLLGQSDPGGATLDQQLAKLLYTGGRRSFTDRVEQVALAVKIDHRYSKPQILRLYLDTAYLGHGYTGITAAARGYFDRSPQNLAWSQASLLAGLVQAPSAYDPLAHYALARSRQRHVLDRLVATRVLTRTAADAVYAAPLGLVSS